jgi:hypothetical protein
MTTYAMGYTEHELERLMFLYALPSNPATAVA